jgi:putative ABC transport system permease protein
VGEDAWASAGEAGRWYEIVGVVGDLPAGAMDAGLPAARLYHPLAPGGAYPASLAVRVRGGAAESFAGRLREVAAALDPALRPHEVLALDEVYRQGDQGLMRMGAWAITLVTVSVLLLSAAGIYALMSFTVTRRRREIGIRAALGADPRRILASVFSRAMGQLAVGLALGVALATLLAPAMQDGDSRGFPAFIPAVALLMLVVGLLAALGPARRGLRIHPMEALREE